MKVARRGFLCLAVGAIALPALSQPAHPQAWPSRAITIISPFPAGGPNDTIARIISESMRASLGQPVVVENIAGANGSIGVGRVARSTPDGHTLVMGQWNTHVSNGALYTLQYDLVQDFEPIALISSTPMLVVGKKALPATDLKGLITWLKSNSEKVSVGTSGVGSAGHVGGAYFQNAIGTRYPFVPYRGAAPAMQDLVAGQVEMMITDPVTSLPQVRAGSIKAYAVAAKSRLAAASNIPTVDEAGLPGFYMAVWYALWAPKGTPRDTITKLNAAVVTALADKTVGQRFADVGQEISPPDQLTPDALGAFQKGEIEKWWPIIRAANIKGE